MRVTWNGSLSFGLVSIPVGLAPATKPAARQSDVSFRLLHRECLTPIKQKRWCPQARPEVRPTSSSRAGRSRRASSSSSRSRARGARAHDDSRTIDDRALRPARRRRSRLDGRTYFLVPGARRRSAGPTSCCSRRWRRRASARSAVRPLRARVALPRPHARAAGSCSRRCTSRGRLLAGRDRRGDGRDRREEAELDLARQIVEGLAADFDPAELASEYRATSRRCSRRSCAARRSRSRSPPRSPPAVDLIEALKASVGRRRRRRAAEEGGAKQSAPKARAQAARRSVAT
jgi:DNA end-binding protein Ku